MRQHAFAGLVATSVLFFGVPHAGAAGWGIYGGGAAGNGWSFWGPDMSTRHAEAGLVLDTAVTRPSVFNYRLHVGYDHLTADAEGDVWSSRSEADLHGLVLDSAFGFRLFQRPLVRVWLGPQVRLARYRGHAEYSDGSGGTERTDIRLSTFGIGPTLGANWNVPGGPTLALTAGWRVTFYNGSEDADGSHYVGDDHYDDFAEGLWFLQLSVLLRFGDEPSDPANP